MRFTTVIFLVATLVLSACGSKFHSYHGPEVTSIVVHKAERRMYLLHETTVLKAYDIELGSAPIGDKKFEGDGKTPEGAYFIDRRNGRSRYHLSLGISYPNDEDRLEAALYGKEPGGDIFIHGRGKGWRSQDWTAGCISVKNGQIEDIYAMVRTGTTIYIKP